MFYVKPVSQVMSECFETLLKKQHIISIEIEKALGCILGEDIIAQESSPLFHRSTVDGFAVIAEDTFGSSDHMPSFLEVTGEIMMGQEAVVPIQLGQAQRIATGGMLPDGSNAVVMQEYTELLGSMVSVYRAVSPGENVIKKGEDIEQGEIIFTRGHRIRPQDIGLLAAMGITEVAIIEPIRIAVISTGDELVDPKTKKLKQGQIRDTNGYSITAFLRQKGYKAMYQGIIPDQYNMLHKSVNEAYSNNDIIIISGGSSVGTKDVTSDIINTLPNAKMFVHGIAIKPGKPTIIATSNDKLIVGLPGHPVSALVILQHIITPLIDYMQGIDSRKTIKPTMKAKVTQNIDSQTGRTDIIRVRLVEKDQNTIAEPVLSKAGVFSSVVKADGYIVIPESVEGIVKDSEIIVYLYE